MLSVSEPSICQYAAEATFGGCDQLQDHSFHDLVITVELSVLTNIPYNTAMDDPSSTEFGAVDAQIQDALNTARYMFISTLTLDSTPSVSLIRGTTKRSARAFKILISPLNLAVL